MLTKKKSGQRFNTFSITPFFSSFFLLQHEGNTTSTLKWERLMVSSLPSGITMLELWCDGRPIAVAIATVPWGQWAASQKTQKKEEGQWKIKGRVVEAIPPSAGKKRTWFVENLKAMIKSATSLSAFYYLYVLPILNTCSDNTCLPEKKNHFTSIMYRITAEVFVDFTYKSIYVTFKWACFDDEFFNKHGVLCRSYGSKSHFPQWPPPMPTEQHIFLQEFMASNLKLFKLTSVTEHVFVFHGATHSYG